MAGFALCFNEGVIDKQQQSDRPVVNPSWVTGSSGFFAVVDVFVLVYVFVFFFLSSDRIVNRLLLTL